MNKFVLSIFGILALLAIEINGKSFSIDYDNNQFLKDGQPFRYVSGCMHYWRIPEKYWQDRLLRLRAMGANAVETYVAWNFHEKTEEKYDFSGNLNITKFIQLAQSLDLVVILRPGPFIDAEVDMGGFPAYLLKIPDIKLRTSDQRFTSAVSKWFNHVLPMLKPLTYANGGPIIMVQIENEYGSFYACDTKYLEWLRDTIKGLLGEGIVYFTADQVGVLYCGAIKDVYPTLNFGPQKDMEAVQKAFEEQRWYAPNGPLVVTEFYPGWFDTWGEMSRKHQPEDQVLSTVTNMLKLKASFSIYMAHGGTNFGYTAGGESYGGVLYASITTSYDYQAPISEAGDLTPLYTKLRDAIEKVNGKIPYSPPGNNAKTAFPQVELKSTGSLFDLLPKLATKPGVLIESQYPLTSEQADQPYGLTIYSTTIPSTGTVTVQEIHDRGYIFLDSRLQGKLQRKLFDNSLSFPASKGQTLHILTENQGRVCWGANIDDRKGLLSNVTVDNQTVENWQIYRMHEANIFDLFSEAEILELTEKATPSSYPVPAYYVGQYTVSEAADTFVDTTGWTHGYAFAGDGVNLGRYWGTMGPQITLYHPYVKSGENMLGFLELDQPCYGDWKCVVNFRDGPKWNK